MLPNRFLILFLLVLPSIGVAQDKIRGYVTDNNNDLPIELATILVEDLVRGITDEAGYFELDAEWGANGFTVQHVGYATLRVEPADYEGLIRIRMEPKQFSMEEVVVQGFNNERSLAEVPGPVALIGRKELDRDNQTLIASSLNRIPGVFMQSGALNTNRITIRGIGARSPFATQKIRAYLNDIPLTTGDGESTIEDIDLSTIDRVEVLKGPSSSIYGAGLGGVINLRAARAGIDENRLQTELTAGSYGLLRWVSNYEVQKESYSLLVNYNTTHSDGYRDNNEYDRRSLMTIGQWYQGERGVLTFLANYIDQKAFIPSSIDSATFASNPSAAAPNWGGAMGFEDYKKALFGLSYQNSFNSGWRMYHSIFYSFRDAMEVRPNPLGNLFEDASSLGLRTRFVYEADHLVLQLGAEGFLEDFETQGFVNEDGNNGNELFDNQQDRNYVNFFSQLEYRLGEKFELTAGFNLNQTFYKLSSEGDSENRDFDWVLSPRIALFQKISENIGVFYAWSQGFTQPTFEESLDPDGNFNASINEETGNSFEVGSRGKLFSQKLWYDVSLYSTLVNDLIVTQRDSLDREVFINAGETRMNGVEAMLKYPWLWEGGRVEFFGSLALYDYEFRDFTEDGEDFSGNQLTGVPSSVINAGLDLQWWKNWYGNLNLMYVDEMPMRDDNSIFSEAYTVSSMKIGYQRSFGKHWAMDLSLGINNLFDEKYASMISINAGSFGGNAPRYYYPGLPRNYYTSFRLSYNFAGQ